MPRWLEAFPTAKIAPAGSTIQRLPASALVWLRLDDVHPALEQLAVLRKAIGTSPVIALSNHPDNEEALSLFSAGVRGYCNAHAAAANLRQVANVVQAGGLWIGEALMQRLLASTQTAMSRIPVSVSAMDEGVSPSAERLSLLTKRELEVARTVAGGSSNKEIARQLGITERTVKAHVGAVFQKLKVRDRLHLALVVNGQRLT
ncbi:MAG: LuxR family transcriptional regulator [Rhodocyclaceae bacterium]|nr:MAG: LuxR family transcriptional regulator [Rhodocyclaceae bacterium]TND01035.1 MAG: LuxR family transcriptional regulator [Rhodocyclaceae bacterium]